MGLLVMQTYAIDENAFSTMKSLTIGTTVFGAQCNITTFLVCIFLTEMDHSMALCAASSSQWRAEQDFTVIRRTICTSHIKEALVEQLREPMLLH